VQTAALVSSYSDPAVQESLFHAAEQHVAAHQARMFDLLAIQLHHLNTAQDAPSQKNAIEKLQELHQMLSRDPRAGTYVKTQALWQICQQRISTMQSIQPTSAPSLFSRVSHYAHRSFEWLKTHPLIPVAIAGILVAGYWAAVSIHAPAPLTPFEKLKQELALADRAFPVLSSACREAAIGYRGVQESDLLPSSPPVVNKIEYNRDIICYIPLTESAQQRLNCGGVLLPTETFPYPTAKLPDFVRSFLAKHFEKVPMPLSDRIMFKAYFGYPCFR
jgi:hypothetical protein